MKLSIYAAICAALGALALASAWGPGPSANPSTRAVGLEVHEWGTFTSMQGVEGGSLEGLHREEEALPAFVHRVAMTPISSIESEGKGGLRAVRVTEKMETPVIYFYADKPMNVDVSVSYSGVLSEWFPSARHTISGSKATGAEALDVSAVQGSTLGWSVQVTPAAQAKARWPKVEPNDPWAFARETKASTVTDVATGESEGYLFYRGLGAFALPIRVEQKEGALSIENGTGSQIPAAFVLEVEPGGARWLTVGGVGRVASADIGAVRHRPPRIVANEIKAAVKEALVATGLFEDEAEAMIKTWSRSWFESEGSRVIYIVPPQTVESMLPLYISPQPDHIVRTLVGRLEYVTPKVAAEVLHAVCDRFSKDKAARTRGRARLARLGRYLEPHLRRIIASSPDAETLRHTEKLLAAISR